MLTPEQCLRIRDTFDKLLNDPESVIFVPHERQEEMHGSQNDTEGCGPSFARRFFLSDDDGNFWNGHTWTSNFQDAELWADADEAAWKMHDLMKAQVPGALYQFVAPVFVDVKSEEPVDLVELQAWLDKAVKVFMNAKHGVGPGDAMVMLRIDWEDLKKRELNEV